MCSATMLAMLAFVAFQTGIANSIYFWVLWVAALVFNMNWWRKLETKF